MISARNSKYLFTYTKIFCCSVPNTKI